MAGGEGEMRSLALTPTWSVATVLTLLVAGSLLIERSIHRLSNVSECPISTSMHSLPFSLMITCLSCFLGVLFFCPCPWCVLFVLISGLVCDLIYYPTCPCVAVRYHMISCCFIRILFGEIVFFSSTNMHSMLYWTSIRCYFSH